MTRCSWRPARAPVPPSTGSHRVQILCPEEEADPEESFTDRTIPVPEEAERVQSEMRAGDILFFHGSLVHGSRPNTSTGRFRRFLIFHYVSQRSVGMAQFYQPLLTPTSEEVMIEETEEGGPCGTGWVAEGH